MPAAAGRRETIRYHEEFYARHQLHEPGTWLSTPSPFVLRAIDAVSHDSHEGPALVVDLGSGVGRHAIPAAQTLPSGSRVLGVDLLPIAARQLGENAEAAGVTSAVQPVIGDLETFAIASERADLVISCSALEHVSSLAAFEQALVDWQGMTRRNGLHCLVVGVDKTEVAPNGEVRPAVVEFQLSQRQGEAVLRRCYSGWQQLEYAVDGFDVAEERGGAEYQLRSVSLRLLARRR